MSKSSAIVCFHVFPDNGLPGVASKIVVFGGCVCCEGVLFVNLQGIGLPCVTHWMSTCRDSLPIGHVLLNTWKDIHIGPANVTLKTP